MVKVVDFGIAKAMGSDEKQQVTRTGLVVGTPEYMSPEQLSGDPVDGRSDIYSLGLVFFRMLTGLLPFQADGAQEIMVKRLTDDPLKLSEARPGREYPAGLQQSLDRALQRMPSDRYASAAEFGRDAVNAVAGLADPPAAPVDAAGATQLVDTHQRTQPQEAVGPQGTAVIPGTRISDQAPSPTTPMTPMPASAPGPRKKRSVGAIAAVVGALVVGGAGATVVIGSGNTSDATPPDSLALTNNVTSGTESDSAASVGSPEGGERPQGGGRTTPNQGGRTASGNPNEGQERSGDGGSPATRRVDPIPRNPAWLVPAGADEHLLDMLFRLDEASNDHAAVRDTAVAYFNAAGMAAKDKATAAYVAAIAFSKSNDRLNALEWARRAMSEEPGSTAYQQLVNDLSRGGGS